MAPKRLLYLDTLRGFFILYLVWLHALNGVVFRNDAGALGDISPWVLLAIAPLAIIATWAPIFALISGTANAYVMHTAMARAQSETERRAARRDLLRRGIITTAFLYALSIANMTLTHHSMPFNGGFHHTLLTSSIQYGQWMPLSGQLFFYNDALFLIGTSGLMLTLALFVLWRGDGIERPRRATAWLAGIAGILIAASPVLHALFDAPFFRAVNDGNVPLALALRFLAAPSFSPFPYAAYAFMGALIGIGLSRGVEWPVLRRWGCRAGAGFIAAAAVLILAQGFSVQALVEHPFPMRFHFLNMGLLLLLSTWLLGVMEFSPEERRALLARRTVVLRRVGMAALSVFLLESLVAVIFSRLYIPLWTDTGVFPRNPAAIVLFLALLIAFWCVVLRYWERAQFKYSFEWLMVSTAAKLRGRRSTRLEPRSVLYHPVPAHAER